MKKFAGMPYNKQIVAGDLQKNQWTEGLLPCPFCGGQAQLQKDFNANEYSVVCFGDNCNVVPRTFEHEKKIIAKDYWNTRKLQTKPDNRENNKKG